MNVYGVQHDITWEDKAANFARVREVLESARPEPGSLVVLPEMFATGFSMNAERIAEPDGGETSAFLAGAARENDCLVLGGMATRGADGRARNEAFVYGRDGALLARYAKLQPFAPGGESDHYVPGERVVTIPLAGGMVLAPFICYDLRFPEVFRRAARQGANLFVVIASWPEARIGHWVALLQARAVENQSYVVGVNRCGSDPHFRYPGRSLVVGPDGTVLTDAGAEGTVLRACLDLPFLEQYRRGLPFLADMRADFFAPDGQRD